LSDNQALQPTPPETGTSPGYSRVSPEQATEIVRLKRINPKITYEQIAAAIGVKSVSTVSYWLRALDNDTVQEARKLAKTNALRATMKLEDQVDHADPRVSQGAAKALVALAGVQEGSAQVQVGVQVVVGSASQPAGPDPFESITATVVDSAS
jgi:transcriptional regulator with XRE-family HTH domain